MEELLQKVYKATLKSPFTKDVYIQDNNVFFTCRAEREIGLTVVMESSEPFTEKNHEDARELINSAPSEYTQSADIKGSFILLDEGYGFDYYYNQISSSKIKDKYISSYNNLLFVKLEDLEFIEKNGELISLHMEKGCPHFNMTDNISSGLVFSEEKYSKDWELIPFS